MNASSIGAVMSSVGNVRGESRLASASKPVQFSLSTMVSFHIYGTNVFEARTEASGGKFLSLRLRQISSSRSFQVVSSDNRASSRFN